MLNSILARKLRVLLFVLPIFVVGCGGGSSEQPSQDGSAQITETGGSVAVQSANSPIYGAKAVIEGETLVKPETITIAYEDTLPAPLNADATALGAKQISKVLILSRTGTTDFGKSVSITMPYDKSLLPDNAIPIVVYWDEASSSYSPIAIRAIDRKNGTITFLTAHASKYVVIFLDHLFGSESPDHTLYSTNTGFDPAVDSFFVHNFGSYDSPGGNCFGMAGYSAWYFHSKKSIKGQGLRSLYKEGNLNKEEDDQIARELIARVYQAGDQKAHIEALNEANDLGLTRELEERFIALSIIEQLIVTKQPQILVMGIGGFFNWSDGHAVTVYGYDGSTKKFLYYDNNYPGEVVSVPWDWENGFGTNTKNKKYDVYAFASFNSAYSPETLNAFFNAAESGFPVSHYPKIAITDPIESASTPNTFEVAGEDNIVVKGNVARPADADNKSAQRYVHVYVNGVRDTNEYLINQSNNTFEISISKLPNPTGTDIMLLVSENKKSWAGGFHAFKQFRIRVANQSFLKNLGFETGDFSGWMSERHVWGGSQQVTPSDKSTVLSAVGFDPIASDLPTPLFGKYIGRVNNIDNGYHISTLSQTAVVPKAKNPVIKFYWAAVLEDPQHDPTEQPYVDISLEDQTKGVILYKKRFYSNDPSYSGWKSYQGGQLKSIPWQLVEIPVAQYVGDTLLLKVEAADCARGGHGGYAYVDAEE